MKQQLNKNSLDIRIIHFLTYLEHFMNNQYRHAYRYFGISVRPRNYTNYTTCINYMKIMTKKPLNWFEHTIMSNSNVQFEPASKHLDIILNCLKVYSIIVTHFGISSAGLYFIFFGINVI